MKLLLTSSGLSTKRLKRKFVGLLEKDVKETRVFVIHAARKLSSFIYVDNTGKELSKAGILLENITYFNLAKDKKFSNLKNYDAIYFCGGNTFFMLDKLRKVGLVEPIKNFVKSGKLYIGVSAGSIIAGKDIAIAGWGSEADDNEINLKNLKGLNFTDIAVYPHYENRLKKEVKDFENVVDYPVRILKDGEALLIQGKKVSKIGKSFFGLNI